MSQSNSQIQDSFKENETCKQSVTSLRKQCLQSLRFPTSGQWHQSKPKTHLLAYMSQFIPDQPQNKVEQMEDFCCFDRMKKIIEKKKVYNSSFGKNKNQEEECLQNEKLMKFIQIQAKMKKMQQNLMKYSNNKKQGNFCQIKSKKSRQHDPSLANLFLTSSVQQQWKDPVIINKSEAKEQSESLPGRYSMKKSLRDQGYKQYLNWQKKRLMQNENNIKQFVETQIQQKVKTMLEERDIKFNQLLKQTKNLQRSILQKNLQIENLKSKQETLIKNIRDLQAFKDLFSQQNTLKNKQKQILHQNFYNQFRQTFPNQTIKSLQKSITMITDKCLQKFNDVECRRFDKWNEQKFEMNEKINKLEGSIQKYKINQNQLLNNIKQIRYEQSVSTIEIDGLFKSKWELQKLQKKILSLYNNWYGQLSESEKQIMKNQGYLQASYQYQQMLQYIMVFKNKFSTDSKVNEYLIKVLRGIQRIRKILFPKTISNPGYSQEMMDPLYILQKLEKYMKCKVYQMQKKGNCQKSKRMSQIIEDQFLGVRIDQNNTFDNNQKIQTPPKTVLKKQTSVSFNSSATMLRKKEGVKRQNSGKYNATRTVNTPCKENKQNQI